MTVIAITAGLYREIVVGVDGAILNGKVDKQCSS